MLERYHQLVDKIFLGTISLLEVHELALIESQMDTEDKLELAQLDARRKDWDQCLATLTANVERLRRESQCPPTA